MKEEGEEGEEGRAASGGGVTPAPLTLAVAPEAPKCSSMRGTGTKAGQRHQQGQQTHHHHDTTTQRTHQHTHHTTSATSHARFSHTVIPVCTRATLTLLEVRQLLRHRRVWEGGRKAAATSEMAAWPMAAHTPTLSVEQRGRNERRQPGRRCRRRRRLRNERRKRGRRRMETTRGGATGTAERLEPLHSTSRAKKLRRSAAVSLCCPTPLLPLR